MKIRNKANLLILIVVVAMFVPLSTLMLHFLEGSLRSTALATADSAARNSAQLLGGGVQTALGYAESVANAAAHPGPEREGLAQGRSALHQLAQGLNFRDGILVLDRAGKVIQDPLFEGELTGRVLAAEDFFTRTVAARAGVVAGPQPSFRTGSPVLVFTAPIHSADGTVIGVVACSYELYGPGPFQAVRQQKVGRTGYVYVVDGTRRMVLHPDPARVLVRDVAPGVNAVFDRAVQGEQGTASTRNSQGIPMLAAYRPVAGVPWGVVAQIPQAEAYAALPGFRRLMLLATAVSLVLLLGISVLAVGYFTRPIAQLHEVAQAFRDDPGGIDFQRTLTLLDAVRTGPEEFATLAQTTQHLLISRRRNGALLRQAAAEWERTFDAVIEAILVLDSDGRILRINRTASDWFRIAAAAAAGQEGRALVLGPEASDTLWPDPARLAPDHPLTWWGSLPGRDGVFEFRAAPLAQDGSAAGMILAIRDITEQARQAEQVRKQALHDSLTGLPNRMMLADRLDQALGRLERNGGGVAVLFLDLDRFKQVNDTHGHEAGDALLREAARRMERLVRRNDTVARLGGDEFVLVLDEVRHPDHALQVAEKVVKAMAEPFTVEGVDMHIGASVGVALAPEDGREAALLMQRADAAMYQAKRNGRGTCCRYAGDGSAVGPGA